MEISEKIAIARKRKGLTQEELASLANVTVRTIQRLESGKSIPRTFTIKTLAKALGTNFEILTVNDTQNGNTSNDTVLFQNNPDYEKHILKTLCLSCFSYFVIPLVHFFIPIYILKKSGSSNPKSIEFGRAIIRQQIYWTIIHSFLLLLTLAYNFTVAVHFEALYLLHFLWPFFVMCILNAFIISYSLIRINSISYECA